MSYDRMGRRVTKNNQRFVYDGYLQIANFELKIPNSKLQTFIWDPTEPVATRPLAFYFPMRHHNITPTTATRMFQTSLILLNRFAPITSMLHSVFCFPCQALPLLQIPTASHLNMLMTIWDWCIIIIGFIRQF